MTKSPTKHFFYWKQAENGLIAHIYEHIAASFIVEHLVNSNLFLIADFDYWAHTYGSLLYLDFNTHNSESTNKLKQVFKKFSASSITDEQINSSLSQISAEYTRAITYQDKSLVEIINLIHSSPWKKEINLPALQAENTTSVNTVFSTDSIAYGRKLSSTIGCYTLHFEIDSSHYVNDPAKKALVTLVIQAAALNLHEALNRHFRYYDQGDQWNWGADTVAYRTELAFTKRELPTNEKLLEASHNWLTNFRKSSFSAKLAHLIKSTYQSERAQYLSLDTINNITGGVVIGYAGWKSIATKHNIDELLSNLEITIV